MELNGWNKKAIENTLRQIRLADKALENSVKPVLSSFDVVQTADFTFSPLCTSVGPGDSGNLLLAKRKADRREQYLVKHAYTDCACNEFVYTKLAQSMGYHMPNAVLFQLSPSENRRCFQTEYIIGTRYLNLVNPFPSFQKIREQAHNWREYFSFAALYVITNEMDGLETPLADDGYIYRVDTTDAFPISNYQLDFAGVNQELNGVNFKQAIRSQLISSNFDQMLCTRSCDEWLKKCMELGGSEGRAAFLEPFARIQEIRIEYIDDFLNTLCYFYPDYIGEYFKLYFSAIRQQTAAYLKASR